MARGSDRQWIALTLVSPLRSGLATWAGRGQIPAAPAAAGQGRERRAPQRRPRPLPGAAAAPPAHPNSQLHPTVPPPPEQPQTATCPAGSITNSPHNKHNIHSRGFPPPAPAAAQQRSQQLTGKSAQRAEKLRPGIFSFGPFQMPPRWSRREQANTKPAVKLGITLCHSSPQQNPNWPTLLKLLPETCRNAGEDENKACMQISQRSCISYISIYS